MAQTIASVLVVEDRRLLAESLCRAFAEVGIGCIAVTEPSIEALNGALQRSQPMAALVAVGFGTGTLTEQAIGKLAARGVPTIVMTGGQDRLRLARCVAEGAVGIVDRNASFETVAAMVNEASGAKSLLDPNERYRLQDELRRHRALLEEQRRPFERLTDRERQVLEHLTMGQRADEIAALSFVSMSTVRSQIRAILLKLGVPSQLAAVAMAHRAGVFDGQSHITIDLESGERLSPTG